MKKTLTIILAIVLVLSVCLACVACDKPGDSNNGGGGNTQPNDPTEADLAVKAVLDSYASAWLVNNASDVDLSNDLNNALAAIVNNSYKSTVTSVKAKKDANGYTLTYKFKDKTTTTITLDAPVVDNGIYAGKQYAGTTSGIDADTALGTIINGVFKSIKNAVDAGADFGENGIGFDGTAYFDFHYGDMETNYNYGLRVAGQIGINAKDTFAGIEIVDGDAVIGGLYYEGAAAQPDCKLYLNAGEYKYYIDNADINAIVAKVVEYIQGIINGGSDVPSTDVTEEVKEPFYNKEVTKLSDLLPDNIKSIAGPILSGLLTDVSKTTVDAGTQYQLKVDLDVLLNGLLKGSLGDVLSGIDLSTLPAPLNQLDLGSFQGVGGTILITAVVKDDASLNDLELSYNCGKKDFRFNAKDTEPKVYGPINVAIGIKEFEIGAQDKAHVLPSNLGDYVYFSPLNADVTFDVKVTETDPKTEDLISEKTYVARIVSNVNPFNVAEGVISFEVKDGENYWMVGEIYTNNGTVLVKIDDTLYQFTAQEFAMSAFTAAKKVANVVLTGDTIFKPVVGYITDLIEMFKPSEENPSTPEEPAPDEPGLTPDAPTEGTKITMDQIMKAAGIVNAAKDLMAKWQEDGMLTYDFSGETIFDYYFEINLDKDRYNEVLNLVKEYLTFIDIGDFSFDDTAAKVYVNYNYGDYKGMVYVSVKYKDTTVLVKVDASKWNDEGLLVVNVNVNDVVYEAKLECANWEQNGVAHLTYTADGVKYVDFTLDTKEGTFDATLVANGHTYIYSGSLRLNDVSAKLTLCLDGKTMLTIFGSDAFANVLGKTSFGVPTFEAGATFGWNIPNSAVSIEAKVTLNSWGAEVENPDYSEMISGDPTGDLDALLDSIADSIIAAISVSADAE